MQVDRSKTRSDVYELKMHNNELEMLRNVAAAALKDEVMRETMEREQVNALVNLLHKTALNYTVKLEVRAEHIELFANCMGAYILDASSEEKSAEAQEFALKLYVEHSALNIVYEIPDTIPEGFI